MPRGPALPARRRSTTRGRPGGGPDPLPLMTRSGVLEMLWALQQTPTEDDAWAVHAVDACAQLARFARIAGSDDYGCLLGHSRWSHLRHSRVDWALGVTPTTASNTGQRGWRDIVVVGPQPDRASGHAFGFIPPSGYGAGKLGRQAFAGSRTDRAPDARRVVARERLPSRLQCRRANRRSRDSGECPDLCSVESNQFGGRYSCRAGLRKGS